MNKELDSLLNEAWSLKSKFFEFWHRADKNSLAKDLSHDQLDLIKKLIEARYEILNLFEILLKASPERARQLLLSRYLGSTADPDSKYGGFEYELSAMLDDYKEILGAKKLRELLKEPSVEEKRIKDPRVLSSIMDAMDFEYESEVWTWLNDEAT